MSLEKLDSLWRRNNEKALLQTAYCVILSSEWCEQMDWGKTGPGRREHQSPGPVGGGLPFDLRLMIRETPLISNTKVFSASPKNCFEILVRSTYGFYVEILDQNVQDIRGNECREAWAEANSLDS